MKLFVVLLAVFIASVFAAPKPTDNGLAALLAKQGRSPTNVGRIIGGSAAAYGQIPYIASIEWFGYHICGGVVISTTRVLTAAHCTEGDPASQFAVRVGTLYFETGGQLVQVSSYNQHPGYDDWTLDNDISVLHLLSPLDVSPDGVAAIGIPAQGAEVAAGTPATVSGWGTTSEDGNLSPYKQYVVVPIISNAVCNTLNGGGVTAGMLCAGVLAGGLDACQGDSGGPLTAGGVLVGLVSWGYGCARPNLPGVYTAVSHFTDWINAN